ncbi:MAG: helix-turn-helix domain-containing protein [Bacilli bacterium]|jgi:transcriptional regulator with XRE-family HTH domain|nr:helix-turn-helix domain-containing protein [Bacilli bacterium]
MIPIKTNVAANLTKLRRRRKLTQSELGERFGLSDKAVSKWEHGDALPSVETLQELADFYGVTLDYLTHEETPENKRLYSYTKTNHFNKRVIIGLWISLVWILACVVAIGCLIINDYLYWRAFIWAVPASFLVLIFFNFIWKRSHDLGAYFFVGFMWSLIASVYIELGCDLPSNQGWRLWMLFLLGVPTTIGAILWSHLKERPSDDKGA